MFSCKMLKKKTFFVKYIVGSIAVEDDVSYGQTSGSVSAISIEGASIGDGILVGQISAELANNDGEVEELSRSELIGLEVEPLSIQTTSALPQREVSPIIRATPDGEDIRDEMFIFETNNVSFFTINLYSYLSMHDLLSYPHLICLIIDYIHYII